jgi:peptidyl-prolyl cis-trans isomerase C
MPDPVVAEVSGHAIHLSEVADEIRTLPAGGGATPFQNLFPIVLRRLVEREAVVISARAAGLDDDPAVQRHIQAASDQVLTAAYLEKVTKQQVTERKLLDRYDSTIKGKPGPEEVHARIILVPTQAGADGVIAQLAAGADFATLARQMSRDPTGGGGGDLGFIRRDGLDPVGAAVLFSLRAGEVTAHPVRTLYGWFVLKAEERRVAPTPSFAAARQQLELEIESENVRAVVDEAVSKAIIHTFEMTGKTKPGDVPRELAPAGDAADSSDADTRETSKEPR